MRKTSEYPLQNSDRFTHPTKIMQNILRPSWFLVINSLFIFIFCIIFFSIMLGGVIAEWGNPIIFIGGPIFMLLSAWLASKIYQSAFRYNAKAARHTGILLYIAGGFILFGLATNLGEGICKSPGLSLSVFLICCGFALLGIYLLFCGRQHRRWAKEVEINLDISQPRIPLPTGEKKNHSASDERTPPFQLSLRELLGFVMVVAVVSSLTTWVVRSGPPKFIEHATPEQARLHLPAGASDICYYRGHRGTEHYDFSINEAGFILWAKSVLDSQFSQIQNAKVEPIGTGTPFSMIRYDGSEVVISNGFHYETTATLNTKYIRIAYDKDNQRAYYSISFP